MLMVMSRSFKVIPELKELDSLLRCGICYEYMKNTLITSCSHNYCSYCIRKFMQYKSQCPTCFKEATEPQLRNNRLVDQFIGLFEKVSEKIEDLTFNRLQINTSYFPGGKNEIDSAETPQQTKKEIAISIPEVTQAPASEVIISVPDMFTPRRKPKKPAPVAEPVKLVTCPVCKVDIPERNINLHLDHCLAKSKEIPTERESTEVDRRKPLPKLVYPLLQEKDLRKKLKDLGLSTVGDRKTLVNRHQRFIVLYNSECDSLNPRPVSEIVDQVSSEEKLEKRNITSGNTFALSNTWLTVDKKTNSKAIAIAQKQYLKENKNSFSALVEAIKKKNQVKEPPWNEGPSCSSRTPDIEERESSEMKGKKPLGLLDERSSSPEICVIPNEKGGVGHQRNLQLSFDIFEVSDSSPLRHSAQKSSLNPQRKRTSPGRAGPSGTFLPSQISPEQNKTDFIAVTPPGVCRTADSDCQNSSLDSFPSPPLSKLEEEDSRPPKLNYKVIGSPDAQSVAGSPPFRRRCNSPLVCQFSPNLGDECEPSDHGPTPSPLKFDLKQLSPKCASPPLLRHKRRRSMMKTSFSAAEDVMGEGVARESLNGADCSSPPLPQGKKLCKFGRRKGRRKK